ncbi:transmembrane protein 94-like [Cetorhinus maximus]
MVHLIDGLDNACIRFVYFSLEDELKSKAKLPRGVENIRPHLEHVDNVPLLVPLFTDCTAETMCEMVRIMQEYGEVVCCLGSSLNIRNVGMLLQSDISFSLDPLCSSCCREPCNKDHEYLTSRSQKITPIYLASLFGSLASSVHLRNHGNISIIQLIKQARQMSSGIRKCFLFHLQCQLSLTMIQVLASMAQLPPPLGTTDVFCLTCVYFPLVSISLLGKPPDSAVMKLATGKNFKILPKKETLIAKLSMDLIELLNINPTEVPA